MTETPESRNIMCKAVDKNGKTASLAYCQYLLSPPINDTLRHFADPSDRFSHDQINRYLANDRLRPRRHWEHVKIDLVSHSDGYLIFDDAVIDQRYAEAIALTEKHYSGNAGRVINGIGIVPCVSVNPVLDGYGLIDYRLYDKQGDGKSKLDPVRDMPGVLVNSRHVAFSTVLMEAWYARKSRLLSIERLDKPYDVPLKSNRLVEAANRSPPINASTLYKGQT